jgi:23S rRNA pseudouridine2605 synthase
VFENLPPGLPRVISIGRLDLNSEGLLLLTNDGGLARALELPASALVRRYRARARGRITQERLDRLQDGITVEGVRYGAIEARLDKAKEGGTGANLWITLTLSEGKNREVRKVLEALGLTVNRLIRLAYGPFQLGELAPGQAEEIGPRVIREQLAEHIAPEKLPTGDRIIKPAAKAAPKTGKAFNDPTPTERPAKPDYKPGWARAKKKVSPHGPSKRFKPKPDSKAVISAHPKPRSSSSGGGGAGRPKGRSGDGGGQRRR